MRSLPASRRCEVRRTALGMGVFAVEPVPAREWAIELAPVFDDEPGRHTIQIDEHWHQAYTGEVDDFVNHACDPNTYLDAEGLRLVARRPIVAGEEITLDYRTFEWVLVDPFVCVCDGTPRVIRGFRHLLPVERLRIADLVPAWLLARVPV